jgi:hypothetical protein
MTLYSDKEKEIAIRKFIYAQSNKQAGIADFSPITDCIANKRVTLLYNLPKTDSITGSHYPYTKTYYYGDYDAQTYFGWLLSAVSGTGDNPVTEEVFKKAINQLFMFIFGLPGTLVSKVDLLEPYSIDKELIEFRQTIGLLDNKVDRMNDKIVKALERIQQWQKMYQSHLDELKQEHEERDKLSSKGADENGQKRHN